MAQSTGSRHRFKIVPWRKKSRFGKLESQARDSSSLVMGASCSCRRGHKVASIATEPSACVDENALYKANYDPKDDDHGGLPLSGQIVS